jgi:hypothetical protein
MPGSTLESALLPLGERLWCEQCREALQERIRTLIVQWSVVKVRASPLADLAGLTLRSARREPYELSVSFRVPRTSQDGVRPRALLCIPTSSSLCMPESRHCMTTCRPRHSRRYTTVTLYNTDHFPLFSHVSLLFLPIAHPVLRIETRESASNQRAYTYPVFTDAPFFLSYATVSYE